MTLALKRRADCTDAAVHHVRRSDDVGPGGGLIERLGGQYLDRGIVDDPALRVDQAVVPVAGIGVEGDIGQHPDLRHLVLDRPNCPADQILGVERFLAAIAAHPRRRVGE